MNIGNEIRYDNLRNTQTREELVGDVIKKYKLKVGNVYRLKFSGIGEDDGFKGKVYEFKKAKLLYMNPYYMTFEDIKFPMVRYTLYYFDIEKYMA